MSRVDDLIAQSLGISPGKITHELQYNAIPEWDSVSHVDLMLALEANFGVEIDEDLMVELTSVASIHTFLEERLRKAA